MSYNYLSAGPDDVEHVFQDGQRFFVYKNRTDPRFWHLKEMSSASPLQSQVHPHDPIDRLMKIYKLRDVLGSFSYNDELILSSRFLQKDISFIFRNELFDQEQDDGIDLNCIHFIYIRDIEIITGSNEE